MLMKLITTVLLLALLFAGHCNAGEVGDPQVAEILDLRQQAEVRDAWLGKRLEDLLPRLMRREGIDLWLIIAREYNEVPVQPNTAWSIELTVRKAVPEWGDQPVRFKSEEDAYFDGEQILFLDGRQEELHLIPRQ